MQPAQVVTPIPPSPTAIYLDSTCSIAEKWRAYKTNLGSNPFRTAFGTPKAIHNLVLCGLCQIMYARYVGRIFDCLGFVAGRCGIKPDRDWFANYYLFGAEILLFGTILPSPQLTIMGVQFGGVVWGAAVGAMIQGYDNCKWQKLISKYSFFAATVGACNGALCCTVELGISGFLRNYMPPALAETISFTVTWAGSSKLMCKIEEVAFKTREWRQSNARIAPELQSSDQAPPTEVVAHQQQAQAPILTLTIPAAQTTAPSQRESGRVLRLSASAFSPLPPLQSPTHEQSDSSPIVPGSAPTIPVRFSERKTSDTRHRDSAFTLRRTRSESHIELLRNTDSFNSTER